MDYKNKVVGEAVVKRGEYVFRYAHQILCAEFKGRIRGDELYNATIRKVGSGNNIFNVLRYLFNINTTVKQS